MPRGRPRKNPEDVLIRSAELIGWALGGIEREIVETRSKLASLTAQAAQLRNRIGVKGPRGGAQPTAAAAGGDATEAADTGTGNGRRRRRRKMSPEARKRISEMMKKRWAERKRGK
jgi:hypothetical protein